jgi:hypothetical protein
MQRLRIAIWTKLAPDNLDQRLPIKWGRTEFTISISGLQAIEWVI